VEQDCDAPSQIFHKMIQGETFLYSAGFAPYVFEDKSTLYTAKFYILYPVF